MSEMRDPPRLFESEGASRELAAWLREAHDDGLDAAAVSRVAVGVASQVGASSGGGGSGSGAKPTSAAGGAGAAAKATVGLVGVGAVAGALWWMGPR
jgi:hypothetical protein